MRKRKDLNQELDLVSFMSILSLCICFLLFTVAWVRLGVVEVKQAVGGQAASDTEKKPVLWTSLKTNGSVLFELQDAPSAPGNLKKIEIPGKEGEFDKAAIQAHVDAIKTRVPSINTVLIQPQADTLYEKIIGLMDYFRSQNITDLGVVPL